MYLVSKFGNIYINKTFFREPNISTIFGGEQMFLNNLHFDCEIWTEPSNFGKQTTEKLPSMVAKK